MDNRLETGVLLFENDWPGLFIKGDHCFNFLNRLKGIRSGDKIGPLQAIAIKELCELLEKTIESK